MQAPEMGISPFQHQTRLSRNQWTLLGIVGIGSMLEFWDAYLIGFIMGFLVKPWGLTYGVMGVVLLASGAGAVVGGVVWGRVADRFGRKPVLVVSLLILAFSSLGLAFTPDGNWQYMAVLRTVMGFCTAGYFIQVALVQEFIPPKRRGLLTGVVSAITTGGLLLGSFSGSYIIPWIGWRWTFALGALPAVVALIGAFFIPESARWLSLHGRDASARRSVAWALGQDEYTGEIHVSRPAGDDRWVRIFRFPRHVTTTTLINLGLMTGYYGIVLWAPMLLSQILSVDPDEASRIMIVFSVLGMASRLAAARLADRIGRGPTGGYFAVAAAVATLLAGFVGHGDLLSSSLFWLPLLLAFVFADGGFSVCALYSTEIWPSRLRGSGSGYAGLTGSVGKILGPLGLALLVGSSDIVRPQATMSAVVPAFAFLGACLLVCGVTYLAGGIDVRGRSLEAIDEGLEGPPPQEAAATASLKEAQ
ncbi:MFS transporter [Actinomadura montaniterrae]|uniref:MFS transporter n=1 Tax=Actinomadura montaniterrae TaxID=1803903 RepID=A0A6L3W1W4_9ACTN|nr:MFS transporter [Actinomadura montaniterrae]KAB2381350.1 MFS transporter [Actinomadura montaniterrae]